MTSPLPWYDRASTLPMMPGGLNDQFPNLASLLGVVREVDGDLDAEVRWPDASSESKQLREVVQRLGRCGLLERRSRTRVSLTRAAESWLSTMDPLVLIRIFHNNMQFIGELLSEVESASEPLTHDGIRVVARDIYGLQWNSLDPGRRRTTWLRAAGLLELVYDKTLATTPDGTNFLNTIELVDPNELSPKIAADTPAVTVSGTQTSALLKDFDPSDLTVRKSAIGQIPSPPGTNVIESLRTLVRRSAPATTRENLFRLAVTEFDVVEKSAPRIISMLLNNGLLNQTSATDYELTAAAQSWNDTGDDLELVRILHVNVQFVVELLDAVEQFDKAPALSEYASRAYGLRPDVNGVRTRLHLLQHAGLLYESGWGRYSITPLGVAFRESIPRMEVRPTLATDGGHEERRDFVGKESVERDESLADLIADRLTQAAKAADSPHDFEVAVRDAFRHLGFDAERLGGPGKTDVLLTYRTGPGVFTSVTIDAKSSSAGIIEERAIDFDTIVEHQRHHDASYSCIVGPKFHQSRLPARAKDRRVTLLDATLLAEAVRRQETTALGTQQLALLFDPDSSPRKVLEQEWARADRRNALFSQVISALTREAQEDDDVTHGALSLDNLYFLLRSDLESRPDPVALEQAVKFLCSPLVDCVSTTGKGQYVATEQPATIAKKLRALAFAAQDVADTIESSQT